MKLRVAVVLLVTVACFLASRGVAQKERPTQPFMREKLVYAQGILEGVTLEKYDLVLTNAAKLRDMSSTNAFLFLRNPTYMERITNFQAAVDNLKAAATAKDVQRASAAYSQMTASCIDCHQWFRRDQAARRQADGR